MSTVIDLVLLSTPVTRLAGTSSRAASARADIPEAIRHDELLEAFLSFHIFLLIQGASVLQARQELNNNDGFHQPSLMAEKRCTQFSGPRLSGARLVRYLQWCMPGSATKLPACLVALAIAPEEHDALSQEERQAIEAAHACQRAPGAELLTQSRLVASRPEAP